MLNVLVCGTPGTGKSSLIKKIKENLPNFNFINLSEYAIAHGCIEEYDSDLETQVLDEEKLLERLLPSLEEKKLNIIESIHADVLPSDKVDLVYVCRTESTKLYDRLKARKYNEKKLTNNIEAEIFQTILDEALDSFDESVVTELRNDEEGDLEGNVEKVLVKIQETLRSTTPACTVRG